MTGHRHTNHPMPLGARDPVELVFVFDDLHDWQTLAAAAPEGAEVVVLDGWSDGLAQMAAHLQGRSGIAALHILSHGTPGSLLLGNLPLTTVLVAEHAQALADIGSALAEDGDILVYGCRAGAGSVGCDFVQALALATGAHVAAATGLVGAVHLGGNWRLDRKHGTVGTASLGGLEQYQGVLVLPPDQTFSDADGTKVGAGKTFTHNGVKYTMNGPGVDSAYEHYVSDDPLLSPGSGTNFLALDYFAANVTSVTVSAADDSPFRLNGLSFMVAESTSSGGASVEYTLTPQGGSAITYMSDVLYPSQDFSNNSAFYNITSFTFTATTPGSPYIYVSLDDIDFETPIILPSITSSTYDAATGILAVTGINFEATGGASNDIVANKFTLTGENGATYTLTNTSNAEISSATSFSLTLSATDKAAVDQIVNKNGTTSTGGATFNLAAADDWNANVTAGNTADATNAVTASNVAEPTITSATYNASTGVLVVTGTGLKSLNGVTNDILANKFTLRGEGGSTYTLTDTGNVDITSGTSFTLVLSATDKAGANLLLNKDGNLSTDISTYNLAAAEDWAAGADAAVTVADTTGNSLTVSNVPTPTITSTTYNATTGALVVTGTGFTSRAGATNDIVANKFTLRGEGNNTYTLTDTSDVEITSGNSFTLTLSATDRAAANLFINKTGTISTSGTTYNVEAAEDWAAGADAAVVVADLAGNGLTATVPAPTITSATYNAATGALVVTGTGFVLRDSASDIVANKFTFTGQGGATYTLTDTADVEISSGTSFTLTLSATDQSGLRTLLTANGTQSSGGTIYNLGAAEDWANGADAAVVVADTTGNGITVSNVVSPTLTSATYDASTGTLSVTATGMVTGDAIDATKLSLTGQAGSYTLTAATANPTASNATAFTVTLGAADKLAIDGILNNNGTAAVDATPFNLAGATGWNSTVGAAADTTGNAVTVSNVTAPTITSATYDGTSGILTVTGTGLVQTIGATNDITVSALTITGEGGATRTLSTTGNVEVTSATSFTLTLAGADASAVASLLNKNGTSSASSATTYNIAAADDWNSVVTGGDIADLTGNGITVSNAAPSILSATYDAATGVLTATGVNLASGGNVVVGNLTLTGQGGATYTLTTGNVTASSTTDFSVTLNAADQLSVNGLLNNNGTSSATGPTPFNLAAAANWQAGAGADLTGNAVTVSNVAAPTITSASYDGSTNTLVVTGTGLVKTIGATNDITVSALTITGEGGATRTLSTTGNVEVTSATSFTLTLAGADASAVASLLNKNGTSSASSATTYNIAAADDWNSVVTGGDIADLTGNGITVSNAAPSIVGATYDAATGILSVSAVNMVAGDTIDVSQLSLVGQAGGSYTLTTANTTATNATAFSITLNAADQLAVGGILNTNGSSAVDATAFNLAALASWNASRPTGADPTGNAVTVSNVSAPTITSATYDATTHILTVTGTGLVKTLGATNDITVSALSITGEGGVARTLSTTGNVEVLSATSFAVTLAGADVAAVEALFNKNGSTSTGGTAYNLAAADDWNSVVTGGSIADATSAITVSNVPPPTITSATYDAATGALVVTGTGFSGASGAANDIVANRFSLQGEGGASHTLTTTGNVEITSATSFTLTLSAADKAAVNALANKNGTSSTSANTYNLAAAEDWAAGTDAVVAVADASNGVTVANVAAPTVTSATYNVATGVLVVTGTGLLGAHGAANDILANRLTFTGKAASTYTLTDTANADVTSATAFSLTLSTTDKAGVNLLLDKAGTSSVDNTTYNIALAEDWNAGADAAVVIADLTGNAVTAAGFPSDDGGGTPTPPTGTPIDGVPVVTEPGPGGSTIITIPVVVPTRPDTPGTPSPLADIPLVTSPSGTPIVSVGVPTGVGLQAEGLTTTTTGSAALAELGFRIERIAGDSPELTNAGQVFYATLAPNEPLSVQILKPTIGAGYDGSQPLVITGSNNPADGKQAVIVDARSLPSGTVIQVDDVEFLAVVGAVRVIGGAGQNAASGDSANQWIVLGADDDTIHGGGGNDTVGSEGGDDQVYGDAGDDIVFGGAGNDLLSGGTGSDKLNGGTGFDVAMQEGQKTDYTVTLEGAGIKLTHTASGVSDWLVDVEQVRFATGPSLTVAHSAAEEAGAYLFQKWVGRDLNQGEGAIIQSLTGKTALEVATLFAQFFPEQSAGRTPAQLLEGMGAAGAVRVDAVRDVTVTGDAGHNTISPTLGLARYVDGGAGTDTVVIPATLGQTHVQAHGNGSFTLQRLTDGAMLDTTRVERVTFSDTKLALDLDGNAGQAAKLLGALGGPGMLANKGVVGEVIRLLDAGATSQTIAGLGLQLLGANTPTQIAQTLWTNLVGRAGTEGELKLLTDLMAGGVSAGELVVMAANLDANAVRIDLVGLTAKGIEFA
ncbi:DUF4347 domain-containing protein [Acidovorax sp.]|uniref:DUF4347 domain-containing protein n=1 Tax=Acidovorax sp. TaxID=1872122 RepID=UPI002ACE7182|nr:DUF4347 domain-containing protein [Acidovorax sp.]MDZ7862902.1 DUF4347 domain-containing protein [Acidovorax sp.]